MTDAPCSFFKKRTRVAVRRKQESSSSDEEPVAVARKIRRPHMGGLHQKTAKLGCSHGDDDDEANDAGDQTQERIAVSFKASHSKESCVTKDQLATATYDLDTDHTQDAQSIFEKAQKLNKEMGSAKSNVYKGMNNYTQYIEKKDTVMGNASSGFNRKGPMRAPTNLRATVRWDYQPDVCKDYKETGYCTFGDSCKFLHDRSDYKHGWQIDQEIAEGVYGIDGEDNRYEIIHHSSDEDLDDSIPLNCLICRKAYKNPVVTKHYFCEECALKRYRKTARCYACTEDTKGFFKVAKDLPARVAAIRQKLKAVATDDDSDGELKPPQKPLSPSMSNAEQAVEVVEPGLSMDLPGKEDSPPPTDSQNLNNDLPDVVLAKYPAPSEPNWAKPELVEFCDSDEESD